MHGRVAGLVLLTALCGVMPASAQTTGPLQFQLIDVNRAVRGFNANSLVRQPAAIRGFDASRFFPRISLAPFPPRTVTPQLPAAFNVPPTTSPVDASKFPFIHTLPTTINK